MSFQIQPRPTDRSIEKSVKFEEGAINPFKTGNQQNHDEISSQIDLIPTKDSDVFASDEFNKMYHEHIRKKEGIRLKIEKMQREKAFIEDLKPADYIYYKQKTNELQIKQNYEEGFEQKPNKLEEPKKFRDYSPDSRKKRIQERIDERTKDLNFQKDASLDLRHFNHCPSQNIIKTLDEDNLTGEQNRILAKQREDLKIRREKDQKYRHEIDPFVKIPEERLLELQKKVDMLLRENQQQCTHGHNHHDEGKVDFDAKTEFFNKRLNEFVENQHDAENIRGQSQQMLHEMQIMENYLIEEKNTHVHITGGHHHHDDNNEQREMDLFHKIGDQLHIAEDRSKPQYDELGNRKFNLNIHDILPFSDINGGVVEDQWEFGKRIHNSKIDNFRSKKKYQYWLEDDEEDIEAAKIYSDVKNLQQEKYFNLYFNYDREVENVFEKQDRKDGEEKLITLEKTIKEKQKWNRNTSQDEQERWANEPISLKRAETALPGKMEKQGLSSLHYN